KDLLDISDRIIWITGASSGIGLHLCKLALSRGATVIATSRSACGSAELETLVENGERLTVLAVDVNDPASIDRAIGQARARHERIDVLLNNAGTALERMAAATSDAEWERVLGTNLTGPFRMCRAVLPLMRPGASIINISSVAAHKSIRTLSAYSASKAGLEQFSRVLAAEAGPAGIRVNVVAPGYVRTPMNQGFLQSDASTGLRNAIPLGRFGEPSDLDGLILLLASD